MGWFDEQIRDRKKMTMTPLRRRLLIWRLPSPANGAVPICTVTAH